MERITIAQASRTIENALAIFDDAYWCASQITHKDSIYDLVSILQKELNELSKLSVEDHYMAFEPVTAEFRGSSGKLKLLQNDLYNWIQRSETASALENELPNLLNLLFPAK